MRGPRSDLDGSLKPRLDKILVSPGQAAELLSIGRTYLYELLRTGEIRSVQVGRLRRIPVAALRDYVEMLAAGSSSSEPGIGGSGSPRAEV